MKKINIFYVITLIFGFILVACENTNENLVKQVDGVVPILVSVDPESPMFIDLEKDSVTFSAALAEGDEIDNAAIQVTYQDKKAIIKEITLTNDTSEFKISGSDILKALKLAKEEVALGERFIINIVTTKNGVSTISKAAFVIKLPCEYDPALNHGSYSVVSTDWNINANATIDIDANDPNVVYIKGLAEADGLTGNGSGMKITIDPLSFKLTGEKTVLAANCGGWGPAYAVYTNYSYTVVSGIYSSCTGDYSIVFDISTDQEDFGEYKFTFTK